VLLVLLFLGRASVPAQGITFIRDHYEEAQKNEKPVVIVFCNMVRTV